MKARVLSALAAAGLLIFLLVPHVALAQTECGGAWSGPGTSCLFFSPLRVLYSGTTTSGSVTVSVKTLAGATLASCTDVAPGCGGYFYPGPGLYVCDVAGTASGQYQCSGSLF